MLISTHARAWALGGASLTAIALSCALASPAAAQERAGASVSQSATPLAGDEPGDEQATQVDEIVVTGFRASLRSAIATKRAETSVVDVINAEDIADFPDNNLAESIQRIPGVAIDREGGEGRSISVRGLGPDFTRVRLNGIEALATTGGADSGSGTNRGRGFDFNIFASELFQNITVRKTQAAEVEEGSLGATVDLQASRPLDYDGFTLAASAQYGWNDLSEQGDPRFAALISNRWLDGKFGALFSVAHTKRRILEEGYNSTRWANGTTQGGFCSPVGLTPQNPGSSSAVGANAANCATSVPRPANTPSNVAAYQLASRSDVFHPRVPSFSRTEYDNERLGITGALQFRPTERTELNFDVLYAKLDSVRQDAGLSAIAFSRNQSATSGGKPQIHVLQAEIDANRDLVYGVFDNVDFRSNATYIDSTTEFEQYTLSGRHEFSDRFRVSGIIGRASSDFDTPNYTIASITRQNVDGFSWDYRNGEKAPDLVLGFDPNDPSQWSVTPSTATAQLLSEQELRPHGVENILQTGRIDFDFDVTEDVGLKFGAAYKKYDFYTFEFRRQNQSSTLPALPAGTTIADVTTRIDGFGSGFPVNAPGGWVVPSIDGFARVYGIYCNCNGPIAGGANDDPDDFRLTGPTNGDARRLNQSNEEEDTSYYAQLDFTTDRLFGGRTLRGDLGVRYVETKTLASGFTNRNTATEVFVENTYEDTLPSLNLALDLTDDLVVRFGAAKVMARPTLGSLNPGGSLTTSNPSNPSANVGNPYLEPYRATTYDLSAEWYFAPDSLLSFAYFYKDISTYVQQLVLVDVPFSQGPLAAEADILPSNYTGAELWDFTTFVNTEGGPLKGFEVSYQQPFTFLTERFDALPEWVGNFGALLNYTNVQSEISYAASTAGTSFITADLLNLSKESYNGTFYYEDDKLSARVSASYRSGFLTNIPAREAGSDVEGRNETLNVDASVSYALTDQVSLTFEGLNLTDEYTDRYIDTVRNSPYSYLHSGRQFYVGARYRF